MANTARLFQFLQIIEHTAFIYVTKITGIINTVQKAEIGTFCTYLIQFPLKGLADTSDIS